MPTTPSTPVSHTPLRHRLLAEIGQRPNGYRAHVALIGEKATYRVDGNKVHGAVTQSLTLLLRGGLIAMSRPEPMRHHEPRTFTLTDLGQQREREWTAQHGSPLPPTPTRWTVFGLIITDQCELVVCAVVAGDVADLDGSPPGPGFQRWSDVIEADTASAAARRALLVWNSVDAELVD
jgi:hypothetical protein